MLLRNIFCLAILMGFFAGPSFALPVAKAPQTTTCVQKVPSELSREQKMSGWLQTKFEGAMHAGHMWLAALLALLAGFLTALSPCVYPLIPITLGVMGTRQYSSRLQGFALSSSYVGGMVVLFSALGITFASVGLLAGSALQNQWVNLGVGLFFILMAASLFGAFNIVLPHSLMATLHRVGGHGYLGAFFMGLVAGIVAAPCTGPVLAVILTLIAAQGDLSRGAVLMVLYAIGMGVPFLVLGTFSSALSHIPKSGPWMTGIKNVFGVIILLAGVYYLQFAIPPIKNTFDRVQVAIFGAPKLAVQSWHIFDAKAGQLTDFERLLKDAKDQCKPAIIDFYADWCVSCKELEKHTLKNQDVAQMLEPFVRIKIDATRDTEMLRSLQVRYGVVGLPTVLFLNKNGEIVEQARISGFVNSRDFMYIISKIS